MPTAIIRIRGRVNLSEEVTRTLNLLNLPASNSCTIIPETPHYKGMLQKVKDYAAWGPINKKGLGAILPRIETTDGKKATATPILAGKSLAELNIKPRIRLHPPRGGFKSVTHPYPVGDLGNRGAAINDLLVKMR